MGCNCRSKNVGTRTVTASSRSREPYSNVCEEVEQAGTKLNVTIQNDGLYISAPLGSTMLNANTFLRTQNCKGSIANLVRSLCVEIAVIFSNSERKQAFMKKLPFHTVKLHYLQELLKGV